MLRPTRHGAYLRPTQLEELTALAARAGVHRTVLIRRAVALVLARSRLTAPKERPGESFFMVIVPLAPGQWDALTARAARAGVSRTALIRVGVDLLLAQPELLVRTKVVRS